MLAQKRCQFCSRIACIHNLARVGMKNGNWQIASQQTTLAVKNAAAFGGDGGGDGGGEGGGGEGGLGHLHALNVPVPVLVTLQYSLVTSRRRRPEPGLHVGATHMRCQLLWLEEPVALLNQIVLLPTL